MELKTHLNKKNKKQKTKTRTKKPTILGRMRKMLRKNFFGFVFLVNQTGNERMIFYFLIFLSYWDIDLVKAKFLVGLSPFFFFFEKA